MTHLRLFLFIFVSFISLRTSAQEFVHFPDFNGEEFGYISCLAVDRQNNIWVGTRRQGLVVYWQEEERWEQFIPADTVRWITAITIDSRNNKWLGTPESGLLLVDEHGNFIERYPIFRPDSSSNHLINDVVVDFDNVVWIATSDGGLWQYDGGSWAVYTQEGEYLPTNTVTSLAVDRYNNKWIGTRLGLWATTTGKEWDSYDVFSEVRDIYPDGKDNICVSVFDRRRLEWIHCTNELYKPIDRAAKKDFYNIKEVIIDKNKIVWGAASEGIARFEMENEKKGKWTVLTAANSDYTGEYATAIEPDRTGSYAWIGTEGSGVFRLDLSIPPAEEDILFDDILVSLDRADSTVNAELLTRRRARADSLFALRQEQIRDSIRQAEQKARADSLRLAEEQAETDSLRRAEEKAKADSIALAKAENPDPSSKPEEPEKVEPPKKVKIGKEEVGEGESVTLADVNFEPRSSKLTDTRGVEEIYQFLLENPGVKVELGGHTDRNPAPSHPNYERIRGQHERLSLSRAKAVATYLKERGIAEERLTTKGYGGTQPLFRYNTGKNRRVELKVLEIK